MIQPSLILQEHAHYNLSVIGNTEATSAYAYPSIEKEQYKLNTNNLSSITIGKAAGSNISFQNPNLLDIQASINNENGIWYLISNNDKRAYVYHNDKRVVKNVKLHVGDIIFIHGLKLLWMDQFIRVSKVPSLAINGMTAFQETPLDNTKYTAVSEDEMSIDLYDEDSFFSHTPRLRTVIEEQEINIDPPPPNQEDSNTLPAFLSLGTSLAMIASSLMSGYNAIYGLVTKTKTLAETLPNIIIFLAMMIGSIIVPRLIRRYQRKLKKEREKLRQEKYGKYLDDFEKRLDTIVKEQSQIMHENIFDIETSKNVILTKNRHLWNREITADDFLNLRIGIGSVSPKLSIHAPEEHFTLDDDNLLERVYALKDKYKLMEKVPVALSLLDDRISAIISNVSFSKQFIDGLILQLIALHSAIDLIITDEYRDLRDIPFINNILKSDTNLGFSLLMFEDALKNLPQECNRFVEIGETESGMFSKELNSQTQIKFAAEYNPMIDMKEMVSLVADIPFQTKEEAYSFPSSLSFLDIFKVGKIEQLNIQNRWASNNPTNSLSAEIGVHNNGEIFKLDLHEKYHGPHGLIAGSTGSGKSEFIITYILSMAVNYHPDEVQFVLIDYKGGGLAGAFENRETGLNIPHLAGTITNLDTSDMNRTLVSIESELTRRQTKFNEVRDAVGESTMDIYKYQKLYREGVIKEPISHLFIISDEFAELKSQQPEFMDQLISTSRIGRSLGVHLILATQKPTGVVNDQIWSNSKFKVCLRVQSRSDSMEMLKRPEAANLKEAGRFYLQIGYDEYFDIGQAGWGGAKYVPSERIIKKVDDSINFVDNTGNSIKSINDVVKKEQQNEELGDQLTNVVRYLADIAKKENIKSQKLWLAPLSETIFIKNLSQKYEYKAEPYKINPIIGEYDAPKKQEQGLLSLDLSNNGNTMICGMGGSGKENLLSTILYSTAINHSPEEVNFYILDYGAETLTAFANIPHVGDVVLVDESEKLVNLLAMIAKEFERRKKLFAEYAGSYSEYNRSSGKKEPLMVIVLNSYEGFIEAYPRLTEAFNQFIRDGSKYGIVFIITASASNSIRSRVAQNLTNKLCLQLPNQNDYRDYFGAPRGLFPANKFGRGVSLLYDNPSEFQSALISEVEEINTSIRALSDELNRKYQTKAKRIPILPPVVRVDDILFEMKGLKMLPIGIEKNSLEAYVYDFTLSNMNLISATYISNHINFFYAIVKEILTIENISLEIIDVMGIYNKKHEGVKIHKNKFEETINAVAQHINNESSYSSHKVYLILGLSTLKEKLKSNFVPVYESIFNASKNLEKTTFIFADDYASLQKIQIENWYRNNVDNSYGIWLGEDVGSQMALNISSLTVEDKKINFPYISYPIYKGRHMIVRYVVEPQEDETNEE